MTTSPVNRLQNILATSPVSSHGKLGAMEIETMPPPRTMYTPGPGDFNVDPNSPYLETVSSTATNPPALDVNRRGSRFATLVKRVMSLRQKHTAQDDPLLPTTAKTPPDAHQTPSQSSTRNNPNRISHGLTSYSPATSSDTAYSGHESLEKDENFDGTTAVDHHMLPIPAVNVSPVYVEPRPAPDYAKMDAMSSGESTSVATFSSYLSRVHKFLRDVNELPWVAERVTVDYVPGQSKQHRHPSTRTIHRPLHRPSSWYGRRPASGGLIDIDPSTTSGSPTGSTVAVIPKPAPFQQPITRPAAQATQTPRLPRSKLSSSPPWQPTYPTGYVPHNEAAFIASQYPGHSVHNAVYIPGTATSSSTSEQV